MTPIALRPATPDDHPLIFSSFLHEYGRAPWCRGVPAIVLNTKMEALLLSPHWRATMAVDPKLPDEILGYIVFSTSRQLGWIFTKPAYRHIGVARGLLKHAGISGPTDCAFVLPEQAKKAGPWGIVARWRPYLPDQAACDLLLAQVDQYVPGDDA